MPYKRYGSIFFYNILPFLKCVAYARCSHLVIRSLETIKINSNLILFVAILPKMVERKTGHIVLMSSVQGLIAIPDRSAYAASKFALQAFGDALRSEMHQHNINVSVVSPGYVKTAVSLNALTGSGSKHGGKATFIILIL